MSGQERQAYFYECSKYSLKYLTCSSHVAECLQVNEGMLFSMKKKYFTDPCFPKNVTGDSRCKNLFALSDLSDEEAGLILTIAALLLIVLCLFVVVKLLNFLFKGTMASIVKRFINADFPGKFGWLTGYVAILIGTGNFIDKIKLKFNLAVSYIVLTAWAFETQA